MKKVLASKNNTRVNIINVIELNTVSATLPASKKGGESSHAEVIVVPNAGSSKKSEAADTKESGRGKGTKRASIYDANSSDSEGDEFPPSSTIWTAEADNKLRSAHQLFNDDWSKIAAYLDIGQTGSQCMNRWHSYVNPTTPLIVDGWTPADVDKLRGLITHQMRGIVARKVNWKVISAEMNREVSSCQAKWRSVQGAHMHSGRFSAEEDDVILEEVTKWGDRGGHGLWKVIEKRLNRSAESIYKHYQKRLARRVPLPSVSGLGGAGDSGDEGEDLQPLTYQPRGKRSKRANDTAASSAANVVQHQAISLQLSDDDDSDDDLEGGTGHVLLEGGSSSAGASSRGSGGKKPAYTKKGGLVGCGVWTPEMDAQLIDAQRQLGNDWVKVADYCNNGQNNKQCGLRFNLYLDPKLKSKKRGDWTPEEIEQLKSLVVEFQSGGVGHKINWTTISRELNRDYNACKNKWKTVVGATMKRGPFTADEDELIIQRVQEWGTKGGLWTALEKEMGRSLKFIFQRWKMSLQKQVEQNALDAMNGAN